MPWGASVIVEKAHQNLETLPLSVWIHEPIASWVTGWGYSSFSEHISKRDRLFGMKYYTHHMKITAKMLLEILRY